MVSFGRSGKLDTDALLARVREQQEQLRQQLGELEPHVGSGGGGRFWFGLLLGSALGAGLLYFLDSERGEERRQSVMGAFGGGQDEQASRDQEVTGQVEAELFRDASIARDQISITTVDNVVYLRGTANSQEQITEIERRVKALPGVDAVINLLRLPVTA